MAELISEEQFVCLVCLEILKEPVTVPCGHSFCTGCIKKVWDQAEGTAAAEAAAAGSYSCPQCRALFSPRPVLCRNTMLAEVVEKLRKSPRGGGEGLKPGPAAAGSGGEEVPCDFCTGTHSKALKSCLVCLASYCETHLQPHLDKAALTRHRLIHPMRDLEGKLCASHQRVLEMFCRTDQTCICALCTSEEHASHTTVSAEKERTEKQEQLGERQAEIHKRIQERLKELEELKQAVESLKSSARRETEESQQIFTQLIRSIQQEQAEVTSLIAAKEKAAVSQAEERMEQVEQEITELKRRDAEMEQLSKTEDHIHFLQNCQSLCAPPESGYLPSVTVNTDVTFEAVRKAVSELKGKLEDIWKREFERITEKDSCQLTLDPNTAHRKLCLSEGNRKTCVTIEIKYQAMDGTMAAWNDGEFLGDPNRSENDGTFQFETDSLLSGHSQGSAVSPGRSHLSLHLGERSIRNWSSSNLLNGMKVINETSASLNDLIPGSLYSVRVRSQIGEAQSVGESQSILTDPLPPTRLLVSDESETEAVLEWGDPASGGYSGFQIFYSDTNSSMAMNSVNQDVRQYKLTNLTPGEFYNISLRSFKAEASIRKNSTEEKRNFQTVPAQVSSLQCSSVSGGYSLSLAWGNPAGRWTEIEVDVSNGDIKKIEKCGPVQCETRIDGLSPARYYTLAVTTVSGEKRSFKAISIQCQTDTTAVIVGSLFGILILICFVVFLVLFILRRYPDFLRPIEVSKFADYFHRQQADSDIGFADEYQSLGAVGTEQTTKAALTPENRGKNRFINVLPYDWCRVKLSAIDGEPFSDYINANYMPVKCEQYWPLDYTPCTYGDISVTTSSEQKQPDWTLRDFTLKHMKSLESRTVRQFHFTAWPDHGVPDNTATLIQFRALVRKFLDNQERSGPAIVHCSAGVGRTGTLIALDSLLLQIEREKAVGIQSFVQKMRLHRPLMVQTEVSPAQRPEKKDLKRLL
ncbi:UNVERIFIED_CONTAM: hypothetical protein FKN15_063747 [Acipenser sinensis]